MLITPLPGADRRHLRDSLSAVCNAVFNLRAGGGPGPAQNRVAGYLEWATSTIQQLAGQVSPGDLDGLVLTPGYERLLSAAGTMPGSDVATQRVLNGMLSLELNQRVDAFDAAIKALDEQIGRWSGLGVFAVADTSFYIEHDALLEEADFRPLLEIWEDPVRLLVPIVVIDELDSLKKSKDNHQRWRARHTLAVLDRVFASSSGPAQLAPEDFSMLGSGGLPRGEVTAELLFDPPGHARLPINDDEIIDRILAVQPLAAREVTLLTYDTGQSTRARNAGLRVRKLAQPVEGAPDSAQRSGRKARS
jgi:hypothetical protein